MNTAIIDSINKANTVTAYTHTVPDFHQYIQLALRLGYQKVLDLKEIFINVNEESGDITPSSEVSFPCIVSAAPRNAAGDINWQVL